MPVGSNKARFQRLSLSLLEPLWLWNIS